MIGSPAQATSSVSSLLDLEHIKSITSGFRTGCNLLDTVS